MAKLNLEKELYLKNRELYTLHKKSQKLIYNISECIFVLDSKFNITLANKKAEILFGDNSDLVGKKIDRKSFINVQYVLFQLLRRHKYPCKREDFNILKTLDRKAFHDDIMKELFEELNWNFFSPQF